MNDTNSKLTEFDTADNKFAYPKPLSEWVTSDVSSFIVGTTDLGYLPNILRVNPTIFKRRFYFQILETTLVGGVVFGHCHFYHNNSLVLELPWFTTLASTPSVFPLWSLLQGTANFSGGASGYENAMLVRLASTGIKIVPAYNLTVKADTIKIHVHESNATSGTLSLAMACYSNV